MRCELKRAIVGDMDFRSDVVVLASKSQVSCMITSSLGLWLSEFGEADVWLLHKFLLCSNHVKRNELSPISTSIYLKKEWNKNTKVRILALETSTSWWRCMILLDLFFLWIALSMY